MTPFVFKSVKASANDLFSNDNEDNTCLGAKHHYDDENFPFELILSDFSANIIEKWAGAIMTLPGANMTLFKRKSEQYNFSILMTKYSKSMIILVIQTQYLHWWHR